MALSLITDRSLSDVAYYKRQFAKIIGAGWDSLTSAEKTEWLAANLKGGYWHTDLNRVGTAVAYVRDRLTAAGISVSVKPKTDWQTGDVPTVTQMIQYTADVAAIRAALAVYASTPAAPPDMDGLTAAEANSIEQILADVDDLITKMMAAYRHSGMMYAGQGGIRL